MRHWIVSGGGTGGHVTPALALAECARERGDRVTLLGARRGLETRLVPEAGFELIALPAQPVYGTSVPARARALASLARACASAWRILGGLGADGVISIGGYASVPAVVAGLLRRLPVALVEPNAVPGRANRAAARFAARIFVQFEEADEAFGAGVHERVRNFGMPLRGSLLAAFAARPARRKPERPFRLLVFGGSQGARQINDAMVAAASRLDVGDFQIFHQTGEADRDRVAGAYADTGLPAEVVAFEPDMPARYAWADLAVCRAGALTLAELTLAGLPSLLVPYPFAADRHQAANARALVNAGAARMLDENPLPGPRLAAALGELFGAPERLADMGARAAGLARPEAASRILAECAGLVGR